jgi:DNA-binding NtrC family response regulator
MNEPLELLVVDDEPVMRDSLAAWLAEDGYRADTAASGTEAIEKARGKEYAVYFVDLKMPPGLDGIETMRAIRALRPDAAVVIITAYATVDTAVAAMKEGAVDYVVKPCNPEEISLLAARLIKVRDLERENIALRKRLAQRYTFHDIVSKNPRMLEIFELIREVASLPSTVLIEGESGTGKELVARAIHNAGERAHKPFVGVSCGALTETLLESELFGHEKGAFTGAGTRHKGKFELADGGTIFLDEIGDVPPKLQMDLLRVLQERSFFRVGGGEEVAVDVRVIAAANAHLEDLVRAGRFREELFYRLNVIGIRLPPLRERIEDVPLLVKHFVGRFAPELGKDVHGATGAALRLLMAYDWPGNVRELENAVERAIVTAQRPTLDQRDFAFLRVGSTRRPTPVFTGDASLAEVERQAIAATLGHTRGNVKAAATLLGIDRSTLYEKMRLYGLSRERLRG